MPGESPRLAMTSRDIGIVGSRNFGMAVAPFSRAPGSARIPWSDPQRRRRWAGDFEIG
jgi:hypothetical protein